MEKDEAMEKETPDHVGGSVSSTKTENEKEEASTSQLRQRKRTSKETKNDNTEKESVNGDEEQHESTVQKLATVGQSIGWQQMTVAFVLLDLVATTMWLVLQAQSRGRTAENLYLGTTFRMVNWPIHLLTYVSVLVCIFDAILVTIVMATTSESRKWLWLRLLCAIVGISLFIAKLWNSQWFLYASVLSIIRLLNIRSLFDILEESYTVELLRLERTVQAEQKKAANANSQAQQAISKWRSEIGTKERAEAMMEQYKQEAETLSEALHIASEEYAQISGLEAQMATYEPKTTTSGTYVGSGATEDTEDLLKEFNDVYSSMYKQSGISSGAAHVESDQPYDFLHEPKESEATESTGAEADYTTRQPQTRKFIVGIDGSTSRA